MQARELDALCAAIVPGEGSAQIRYVSRGLVNESYRITRAGRDYALRLAIADGAVIALDRAWEARLLKTAVDAGLAPTLRVCDAARGILLSDWLPGRCWEQSAVGDPMGIEQMAGLLRRVHALSIPQPPHRMNPASWLDHYESAGPDALQRWPAATECLDAWAALPAAPAVVCHGDLHVLNLVQSGDALRLLDWEYAHVSEAFWDLAGWCANGDLEVAARRRLLNCYLGSVPSAEQWRRLEVLRWLYDYVCLQWSTLYLNRQPTAPGAAGVGQRAALLDARLSNPANFDPLRRS